LTEAVNMQQQQQGPDAPAAGVQDAPSMPPAPNTLAADLAANKTQERQQQANRLATAYRWAWQGDFSALSAVAVTQPLHVVGRLYCRPHIIEIADCHWASAAYICAFPSVSKVCPGFVHPFTNLPDCLSGTHA
jgi:hypothetical protein